jgi:hypothetical protein
MREKRKEQTIALEQKKNSIYARELFNTYNSLLNKTTKKFFFNFCLNNFFGGYKQQHQQT